MSERASTPTGDELSNIYRRSGPRGRQIAIVVTTLILLLLLVADGLYVVVRLGDDLRSAGTHLDNGQQALTEGDLVVAEREFTEARASATDAAGLTGHPSILLATLFPYVRDDAKAARVLPNVVRLTSDAGLTTVQAGSELGGTTGKELARAFYRDGRVQLETLERAEPLVSEANTSLERALGLLTELAEPNTESLATGIDDARERLIEAVSLTETGSALLRTMPPLLGSTRPQRYLLAFQSNSEARGTGGLMGLYGILEADDGRVNLARVGPFEQLTNALSPATASEIRKDPSIARFRGLTGTRLEVNLSADLPTVAPLLLRIYEEATGRQLDGVLATDPPALQSLMTATGPLEAPGLSSPLGARNTVKVLLHDSYVRFATNPDEQTLLLIGIVKGFYEALGSGDIDGPTLVRGFTEAVSGQHLKLFSRDEELQRGLEALNAAGEVAAVEDNTQLVYHNNLATNKVDYFLERSITTQVTFDIRGNAQVRTEIAIQNGAPGTRNPMTTSFTKIAPPGVNRMQLNLVMPRSADVGDWKIDGDRVTPDLAREGGLPVASARLEIPPQQTARVVATYDIPDATDVLTGGDFTFALLPHATPYPDRYRLIFRPPPGFAVTSNADGERVGSGSLSDSGALDHPVVHVIGMTPL